MNYDTEKITEEYHARLINEGYQVLPRLPFEGVAGKFSLYAIGIRTGREKLIKIEDFSAADNATPLLKSVDRLANAKTRIELETLERRSNRQSALELELVAANVTRDVNNDFCAKIASMHNGIARTEYRNGLLHARISTDIHKPSPTRRFVLI